MCMVFCWKKVYHYLIEYIYIFGCLGCFSFLAAEGTCMSSHLWLAVLDAMRIILLIFLGF